MKFMDYNMRLNLSIQPSAKTPNITSIRYHIKDNYIQLQR